MREFFYGFIILALLSIPSGCAPVIRTDTPEITGQVVDKETKQPIFSAIIELEAKHGIKIPTTTTKTDELGKFHIDKNSDLTFVPLFLPWDFPPTVGQLEVSADGYKKFLLDIMGRYPITINIELESEELTELKTL